MKMARTKWGAAALIIAVAASIGISSLFAQERPRPRLRTTAAQPTQSQEIVRSGTIVDLHLYMTGESAGKDPKAGSRNCIRRGVPAALETEQGLMVLGPAKGTASKLAQHAMSLVEVRGTLYEKHGVKYLEVASIKKLRALEAEEELEDESEYESEDEPEDDPGPEPEPEPEPEPPDDPDAP
jgi:hypothetical protein